jgi:N-acetylneuraminic acid mutarotase
LYVIGGYAGDKLNSVEVYDPETNRWQTRAPLTMARGFFGTGVIHRRIYVVGGRAHTPLPTEVYDPAWDAWTSVAPIPDARNRFGTAVLDNRLHVVGGETADGSPETDLVYDPDTDRWETF